MRDHVARMARERVLVFERRVIISLTSFWGEGMNEDNESFPGALFYSDLADYTNSQRGGKFGKRISAKRNKVIII